MHATRPTPGDTVLLYAEDLQLLFDALHRHGYHTIGPTIEGEMVIYTEIQLAAELPVGWSDEQAAGIYRLRHGDDQAYFGFTPAAHTWKNWLRPASERLWRAQQTADGYALTAEEREPLNYAFIGVRACELRAIEIQDRILLRGAYVDAEYQTRRERTFIVAVNCTRAGGTCFCVSMDSGPDVASGYDLALTELVEGDDHFFVVEIGSLAGAGVMADVPHRPATEDEREQADCAVAAVASHMGRTLETDGLKELLYHSLEHPIWTEIGERCLTCGNCTMVCPTCFCATVEDTTDLSGQTAERWRHSDSCFTSNFSYIYGGSVRASARSRYRQWLTHKLATWFDQFGTSGCVGCGRCITWCPVGIDLTQEVARLQRLTADEKREPKPERSTA